ncbi:alpha/beta hydrolase [Pleomorphomonas sp. PLEO]|uniref:alpha/beta hydrolase n=1 Tax=Pleomorphomonas sp. PLEO TaxID=3239306 RepID=UPI00351E965E
MSVSLVIFLHGVGSRGSDLAPLAGVLAPHLPEAVFVAPDGPLPFDGGGAGRQWFSIRGVTEANRPQRIVEARSDFDATLSGIIREHGLSEQLDRVALVGFSQGSIMALDALASGRWSFGAIVAFSGRLASPEPLVPSRSTRTLLIHGEADTMIPATESLEAERRLKSAGAVAEVHLLPGVVHTISSEGAALATSFLAKALAIQ